MPTYDYQCFACDYTFEKIQKITEDAISICPECGKDKVKRIIASTSFQLKGSGWYATDYGSSGSSSKSSKTSSNNPKKSSGSD